MAASLLAAMVAAALSHRAGGRVALPAAVTLGYSLVAVATGWQTLLSGAAVMAGVLAALLAVMITTPAASYWRAAVEVCAAMAVATLGGLVAAGFGAVLKPHLYEYFVLGFAMVGAFALVYGLGAGLHGLGRRGYVAAAVTALTLAFVVGYSAALGRWGSHYLTDSFDSLQHFLTNHLGSVPNPLEALVGVPALCWGVFMRARRRQGWWVCAFGAAMTAHAVTRFLGHPALDSAILNLTYGLIAGLILGYALIRVEQSLTGSRGRRARRTEEASAHRPEPARLLPLR